MMSDSRCHLGLYYYLAEHNNYHQFLRLRRSQRQPCSRCLKVLYIQHNKQHIPHISY